jgi:hypothetical protein
MFVFLSNRPETTTLLAKVETLARISETLGAALLTNRSGVVGDKTPVDWQKGLTQHGGRQTFWGAETALLIDGVNPTIPANKTRFQDQLALLTSPMKSSNGQTAKVIGCQLEIASLVEFTGWFLRRH